MIQKRIQLKEAIEFVRENGYLLAIYQLGDDKNFYILAETFDDEIDEHVEIMVDIEGCGVSMREFETVDHQYRFVLHNDFNVPKVIPTFNNLWTGILASKLIPRSHQ